MKKILVIFSLTLSFLELRAQDLHFSQVDQVPMMLNPALTGSEGPIHASLNYRNQWKSVASPFQTMAAGFDARLQKARRNTNGFFALGLQVYNDQTGDLSIRTAQVSLNGAYHLTLNRNSTLGLGIYAGLGQRSIDGNNGRWGNQYNGLAYDPSILNGEPMPSAQFSFKDAGTGMVYRFRRNNGGSQSWMIHSLTGGFGVFHVNRPSYSFLANEKERLFMRSTLYGSAEISMKNAKTALVPILFYQQQKSAREFLYGASYRYYLQGSLSGKTAKTNYISLGLFNRWKDAMIAKVGFQLDQYQFNLSYDFTISDLSDIAKTQGAFELSFSYLFVK
jgi:type IX secretion system PorP/SprF family membrane protein